MLRCASRFIPLVTLDCSSFVGFQLLFYMVRESSLLMVCRLLPQIQKTAAEDAIPALQQAFIEWQKPHEVSLGFEDVLTMWRRRGFVRRETDGRGYVFSFPNT